MITKRVLVVGNASLLEAGMERLLSRERGLDVTRVVPNNEADLIQTIWLIRPQVIVMNNALPFITPAQLLNRLSNYPCLKLIVVNEKNNLIQTYEKQSFLATEHMGLAALVRGNELELAYGISDGRYLTSDQITASQSNIRS